MSLSEGAQAPLGNHEVSATSKDDVEQSASNSVPNVESTTPAAKLSTAPSGPGAEQHQQ